ncbi:MAG: hypothetical protein KGL19_04065, partial [Bacteroidota bacterium]|nr:hypothetical protein [Bacteroidota bacterium]
GADSTNFILHQNKKYILVFARAFENVKEWKKDFEAVVLSANKKNIPVYLITSDADKAGELFKNVPLFKCDATVVKTAARANPTYFIMHQALILDKIGFAGVKSVYAYIDNGK